MILNKINNKVYIGQSIDIYARHRQHKSELNNNKHCNKHLQNAWNKYGKENFKFSILCETLQSKLNELEQYYIYCFSSDDMEFGYNGSRGGDASNMTEKTKKKISNTLKGNIPWNKGIKTNQIPWNKGLKCSDDIREKISISNRGKDAWNKTKVVCLNTLEIFNSIHEAGEKYNISYKNIQKNLQFKINSCGRLANGERIVWRYYSDFITMKPSKIKNELQKVNEPWCGKNCPNSKKVICLNTSKIFDSMNEAEKYYNLWKGAVHKSCKEHKRVGKIKYTFMKYDEYIKEKNKSA